MWFECSRFEIYETGSLVPLAEWYRRPCVEWSTKPPKAFGRERNMAPNVLCLDNRWRWSASFTLRPIVLGQKASIIRLSGSLVGPRADMDTSEKTRVVAFLLELQYLRLEAPSLVTTLTELLSIRMKSGQFLDHLKKQ